MKVFLIRHGESEGNAAGLHQHDGMQLSVLGRDQADKLGKRLQSLGIEVLFVSPLTRTQETAAAINSYLKKEIILDPRLREIRRPDELVGKSKDDPEFLRIKQLIHDKHNDPNYHYSNEENFFDVRDRVQSFLQDLALRSEKTIAIVTHGITLRVLMAEMIFGKDLTAGSLLKISQFFRVDNTSVTLCEREGGAWHLLSWNDHGHLH